MKFICIPETHLLCVKVDGMRWAPEVNQNVDGIESIQMKR